MPKSNSRRITTPQSLNAYIKGIYGVMEQIREIKYEPRNI